MSGCYQFQKDVCTNWFLFLTMRLRLISESVLVSVNTGFLTRSLLLFQPQFLRGKVRSKETMGFMRTGGGDLFQEKALPLGGSYDLNCEWKEYVPWWMESRRLFKCRGHCGGRLLKMTGGGRQPGDGAVSPIRRGRGEWHEMGWEVKNKDCGCKELSRLATLPWLYLLFQFTV